MKTTQTTQTDINNERASEQVGLIVGGSGQIGREVAARFQAAGWTVLATYRKSRPTFGKGITWVRYNGLVDRDILNLRRTVDATPGSLRAVVSLIGMPSSKRSVVETTPSEWTQVFEGNVTATVRLWHAVSKRARRDRANVVLISSDTTEKLRAGNGAYSAAKAGLEALAATLAAEEAQNGVRINVLAPSLVESPLAEHILKRKGIEDVQAYYKTLPWGRALSPSEVAGVVFDIAAAKHWNYMSGSTIRLSASRQT